jgi:hypothetical protein
MRLSNQDISPQPKNFYLLTLKHNIILKRELFRILDHLKEAGIQAIPLKGPTLARVLYGDEGLRQASCDLDILVQPEDMEKSEASLEKIGYSYRHVREAAFFRKFRRQIMLAKRVEGGRSMIVDLHCNLLDPFTGFDAAELWAGAQKIDIDGREILFPSYESLLLHLTVTAVSSFDFVQMRYLADIDRLAAKYGGKIDWDAVCARAKRLKLDIALFFALKLCGDIFGTKIPSPAYNRLRPSFPKRALFGLWLKKTNVLRRRQRIASSYPWRYFASTYIYSGDIATYLRRLVNKIFLPMDEVMGLWNEPLSRRSYKLYMKRLFNPVKILFFLAARKEVNLKK